MESKHPGKAIYISAMGMTSSLGYSADDSLAAARAGLSRAGALPIHNFSGDETWGNAPVIGHAVTALSDGHVGVSKVAALGRHALRDLLTNRPIDESEWKKTGLYLNLSDHFHLDSYAATPEEWDNYGAAEKPSARWRSDCESLVSKLFAKLPSGPPKERQHLYFGGHTGIAHAIAEATRALQAGELERCIVGGIDSCIELHMLEWAAKAGMLKTGAFPVGFLPGEAACFILLEKGEPAAANGYSRRVSICAGPSLLRDEIGRFSESPPNGRALARVIESVLATSPAPLGVLIGDLNGDSHRANDWGYAVVRLQEKFPMGNVPMWVSALSFGEVGAATGAVAIAMATRGMQRGYAPAGPALIWLASDSGEKAALMLQ
jgi:3-oxoacyl-[acyl-carrier-protein] synthase-1